MIDPKNHFVITKFKLTLYLFCLLFLMQASSCKPDPKPKEEKHYGPDYFGKLADYFMFKPGSYWIYENNRTGELDTCILNAIERDTITYFYEDRKTKTWYTKERINFDIFSNHRRGIIPYRTPGPCLDCGTLDTSFKIAMMRSSTLHIFDVPFNHIKGKNAYYTQLKVGNQIYDDVYRFDIEDDGSLPFWDRDKLGWWGQNGFAPFSSYYWAKDFGLIQIKFKTITTNGPDSAYWQLKFHQIEK